MGNVKLGLVGSAGRMGTAVCEYFESSTDIRIHARLELDGDLGAFVTAGCDLVLDLSTGPAVDTHGPAVVEAALPYIVGATGFADKTIERLREAAERSGSAVLLVPNFSLGANLLILAAASAAQLMDWPVVTERHHAGKADAPSGTARFTANRIAAARHARGRDERLSSTATNFSPQLPGVMGGEAAAGVALHSQRGEGVLAEQSVSFGLPGETLTIEHRSIDRRCFMPGIEYAIRNIDKVRGLQIGLDTILAL